MGRRGSPGAAIGGPAGRDGHRTGALDRRVRVAFAASDAARSATTTVNARRGPSGAGWLPSSRRNHKSARRSAIAEREGCRGTTQSPSAPDPHKAGCAGGGDSPGSSGDGIDGASEAGTPTQWDSPGGADMTHDENGKIPQMNQRHPGFTMVLITSWSTDCGFVPLGPLGMVHPGRFDSILRKQPRHSSHRHPRQYRRDKPP